MITKKPWTKKEVLSLQIKKRDCKDCRWWAWDCNDIDGICTNKSKKACSRKTRQLWEKKLDLGYCDKCGGFSEQLEEGICPHCTRPINQVLVWHDEDLYSWTYCNTFKITPFKKVYYLCRFWNNNYDTADFIGIFASKETAKTIASIIRINEWE